MWLCVVVRWGYSTECDVFDGDAEKRNKMMQAGWSLFLMRFAVVRVVVSATVIKIRKGECCDYWKHLKHLFSKEQLSSQLKHVHLSFQCRRPVLG